MNILRGIADWTATIVIAIAISLVISIFIFQPTNVKGSSMDPTLHDKDIVFLSKLSHTFGKLPDYGDIVVIDSRVQRARTLKDDLTENAITRFFMNKIKNEEPHDFWIKRVIGKPGDVIECKDHLVYRNGKALDEPYIKEIANYDSAIKITVPQNSVFVMGDNRNNSMDSRRIGPVPQDHVIGKMIFKMKSLF